MSRKVGAKPSSIRPCRHPACSRLRRMQRSNIRPLNRPINLIGHATVIDGDTIVIGAAHLRLVGIDTSESD